MTSLRIELRSEATSVSENALPDSIPNVLRRIYANRGVADPQVLDRSLARMLSPRALGVDPAARRLADAVSRGQRIMIVGDFDADGATSVALCVRVLRAFGSTSVDFVVPNRFDFGYGLSIEIVDLLARDPPDVLVTVDNGISSVEGVRRARELGIDVIITDHHLPGDALPADCVIVNPNLADCDFESGALAGVGVAYYVLGATRAALRERGWFDDRDEPNLGEYLDLVALGTVADVVPLDANNRVLVHQGLSRIRRGRCCAGINALIELAGRNRATLQASDLGYAVAPRLNAAGRLDDITIGIRCLLTDEPAEAQNLALALDRLNRARRELEQTMVEDAEMIVASQPVEQGERSGLVLYDPSWHQGVVGLVAARIRERAHRPVVAFADAGDAAPDELKGSARSVEGLHIRDVLDGVATRHPGLLLKFGGHAMAAGLSIRRIHLPQFSVAFDRQVKAVCDPALLEPVFYSDGELEVDQLSLETAYLLRDGGPWGARFPEPTFHGEFALVSQRVVGSHHLRLVLEADGRLVEAIAFRQPPVHGAARLRVLYRMGINDYRGAETLQLVVEHVQPLP